MTWSIFDPFGIKARRERREREYEEGQMAARGITWEMRRLYDAENKDNIIGIFDQGDFYLETLRQRCVERQP